MTIEISAKRVARTLLVIVLLLVLAGVAGQFSRSELGRPAGRGWIQKFDLNRENNVPTWYSTAILLLCSPLLAAIALAKTKQRDPYARHWQALAVIFLLLSLDEAASIHELVGARLRHTLPTSGVLLHAWVIPASILVLITGLAYRKFMAALPARSRRLFVAAAALYVGGALGMEFIEGHYVGLYGNRNVIVVVIKTAKELLEMLGIVVFLYALMSYLRLHVGEVRVRFKTR